MTSDSAPKADRWRFASDNYAGICPEAWDALAEANVGQAPAYGYDQITERACDLLREFFEIDCELFFTFNGTAANSLALATLCRSYHSIVCHELAHLETDECGAPEFFSNGTKVLVVPGKNGKLDLAAVEDRVQRRSDVHYPKPKAVSITQATEVGTIYSVEEVTQIGHLAKKHDLHVHMDGARFANALASLDVSPAEITWKAGVDVLCFGGTKNGMPVGEAVVFFKKQLAQEFEYRCKQAGQLCSKMRFLAAPWVGMLQSGAMIERAKHANAMAQLLHDEIEPTAKSRIMFPRQANSLFVDLPPIVAEELRTLGWQFYTFIGKGGARLMCSWDTTAEDVKLLAADLCEQLKRHA